MPSLIDPPPPPPRPPPPPYIAAAAPSAVTTDPVNILDRYLPVPAAGGSAIRRQHLMRTHAFEVALLNRRLRLFTSEFRRWFKLNPRRVPTNDAASPAAPSTAHRNAVIPRIAAVTARSFASMEMDVNAPPASSLPPARRLWSSTRKISPGSFGSCPSFGMSSDS
jgi:hypothetical protein